MLTRGLLAQGGRQDQDDVRAAFIQAIGLVISRGVVSMTNSRLLYASTRRCVGAQPWGVSPHPRRAQRDAGPCCLSQAHQAHSAVLDYVIYGRRLASGRPYSVCPASHRCLNRTWNRTTIRAGDSGDWAMECGLEVERVALNRPQLFSPSIVRGRIDHRHR